MAQRLLEATRGVAGWLRPDRSPALPQEWLLQLMRQGRDQTRVERLQLNPDNTGRWAVGLGPNEWAIIVVSGRTRVTTEPAEYWYTITITK